MAFVRVVHVVCYALVTLGLWAAVVVCLLSLFHRQWEDALICFAVWWLLKVVKYYVFDRHRVLPGLGVTVEEAERRLAERHQP
jgi:hypothetical protein